MIVIGCGRPVAVLLPDPTGAPPEIREACARAEEKCTRCHTTDRIVAAGPQTRFALEKQVTRIRLMPSSGISKADATIIVECLVYRSQLRTGEP